MLDDCPLKINNHLKCYLVASSNIHARNGNVQFLFRVQSSCQFISPFSLLHVIFLAFGSCSAPSPLKVASVLPFGNHSQKKTMKNGTASMEIRINFHFVVKRENWTRNGIRNKNKKWNCQTYRSVCVCACLWSIQSSGSLVRVCDVCVWEPIGNKLCNNAIAIILEKRINKSRWDTLHTEFHWTHMLSLSLLPHTLTQAGFKLANRTYCQLERSAGRHTARIYG